MKVLRLIEKSFNRYNCKGIAYSIVFSFLETLKESYILKNIYVKPKFQLNCYMVFNQNYHEILIRIYLKIHEMFHEIPFVDKDLNSVLHFQ